MRFLSQFLHIFYDGFQWIGETPGMRKDGAGRERKLRFVQKVQKRHDFSVKFHREKYLLPIAFLGEMVYNNEA